MANLKYDKEIIGLLLIDPYNDFISESGKIWDRIRAVAEANDCVPNMLQVLNAARKAFENGTWDGEIRPEFEPQPGDIVALEHGCPEALPTPIWICCSKRMASTSSSSSGS
jgi:nicotinamidase-related amidase